MGMIEKNTLKYFAPNTKIIMMCYLTYDKTLNYIPTIISILY